MNVYETMATVGETLGEQIAGEVFETLSENGPVLSLMDRQGHCWSSDPAKLTSLGLDQALLDDLLAKIDDGAEPAVAQVGETTLVGGQLATDRTNCGYLVLAVARGSSEWTPLNFDLVETVFGQVTLVARLLEDKRLVKEIQARCISMYGTAEAAAN